MGSNSYAGFSDGYDTDDTDEIYRRKGVAPGLPCSPTGSVFGDTGPPDIQAMTFSGPSCIVSDDWLYSIQRDDNPGMC